MLQVAGGAESVWVLVLHPRPPPSTPGPLATISSFYEIGIPRIHRKSDLDTSTWFYFVWDLRQR
ncbi:hypothetical protein J6590_038508 [Homalodisca vitripennis]|nr:hypothetical protein J6590_038508 [Homalodisca vitripennis]